MSSTNRGGQRTPADFYPTPAWCVWRLLEACELPAGRWLEPCAGDGAIVTAVSARRRSLSWSAIELRPECERPLRRLVDNVFIGDFLASDLPIGGPAFDVVISNPPYSCAQAVVDRSLTLGTTVVMLLRLNFLASGKRAGFMREHAPDVYVLPNRPSFDGRGTDSVEYAWFVWPAQRRRASGSMQVLASTPLAERRAGGGGRPGQRATTSR